jgi:hypothetical protein
VVRGTPRLKLENISEKITQAKMSEGVA